MTADRLPDRAYTPSCGFPSILFAISLSRSLLEAQPPCEARPLSKKQAPADAYKHTWASNIYSRETLANRTGTVSRVSCIALSKPFLAPLFTPAQCAATSGGRMLLMVGDWVKQGHLLTRCSRASIRQPTSNSRDREGKLAKSPKRAGTYEACACDRVSERC